MRILSAGIAAALIIAIGYYAGPSGLIYMTAAVAIMACYELSRIAFRQPGVPKSLQVYFLGISVCWLLLSIQWPAFHEIGVALGLALFVVLVLISTRNRLSNDRILMLLGEGALGFMYCLVFPSYAIGLLKLDFGLNWYAYLLVVVFAGDTAAYFGGYLFGNKKLLEQISPKKTIAGSYSGLLGSAIASLCISFSLLPNLGPISALFLGVGVGVLAQAGDLLASLLKRVGQVKDSGRIMPGHGGALDRLDGVFLACPLVYWAATV